MTSRAGICLAGLMFAAQALSFEQVTAQETSQTITGDQPHCERRAAGPASTHA
jgi:hypothetical protein